MIRIEQAIYGEKQGVTSGHDLLAASEEKDELFKRVSGYTDLADRPEGGVLSQPVVRGFLVENYFLLVKTFPDSEILRSGRVFAHALFIKKVDLPKVKDITNLFKYQLNIIDKEAIMTSIQHAPINAKASPLIPNQQEIIAANALVEQEMVVWLSEEGYWEFVKLIWPRIPIETKMNLRIGPAFNPQRLNKEAVNIVFIPTDAKSLWAKHSIHLIDSNVNIFFRPSIANWLCSNINESSEFQQLLEDFSLKINSLSILKRLHDNGKVYHTLEQGPKLGPLLAFANFISQINTSNDSGIKGKEKLHTAILNAIPNATVSQIKTLIHQTWKGFPNTIEKISEALNDWLTKNLFNKENVDKSGSILVKALQSNDDNWWTQTVISFIKKNLKNLEHVKANTIWSWMMEQTELILKHSLWLPDTAENELTKDVPKLKKAVAELVVKMAIEKNWLILHAKIISHICSPLQSIEAQLSIDKGDCDISLRALSETIEDSHFVEISSGKTDYRLHQISGEMIAKKPPLIEKIDITTPGGQRSWELSIIKDGQVWVGIKNPQELLFKIMDHLISGKDFNENLLIQIADSKVNDLIDYSKRSQVWEVLPNTAKQNFLLSTSKSVVNKCLIGTISQNEIENPILNTIASDLFQTNFLNEKETDIESVLKLYEQFLGLQDTILGNYITYFASNISESQAIRLGALVSQHSYSITARCIYDKLKYNSSFTPAYLACSHLVQLSFFEKHFSTPSYFGQNTASLPMNIKNSDESSQPIVVILTAIKEEYQAVRRHLVKISDAFIDSTTYESGVFEYEGKFVANMIIRECGAKNTISSQEAERAIRNFNPNLILFVGIAGSRKPNDFKIGDVIFPNKVYYYEGGKASKDSFKARPDAVEPSYELIEMAKNERSKDNWKNLIKETYKSSPNADIGIIASGEQLIDHTDSEIGKILANHYNDASVVEMEGYGFLKAAIRQGKSPQHRLYGIVRGISDIIENNELDQFHLKGDRRPKNAKLIASDTAAAFAYWLIFKTL